MRNKSYSRREFMTRLTAGAGTAFLGSTMLSSPLKDYESANDPLPVITLGRSGIKTTLLGMGTGFNGYNRSSSITRAGKKMAESLIRNAYDKGIRYFDCADSYGTHSHIKVALKGIPRESYTIGTKIWFGKGGIPEPERPDADIVVDRFRKELDTDYIDLVQIHCVTAFDWPDQHKRQMEILEKLKVKKVILAHGVSVHSLDAMKAAAASQWVDIVHVRINPYGEAMDHQNSDLVVQVIEKLHQSEKGVIGMKLIGNGNFRNDPEKINASLKYVLSLGIIDMIIVGFELPGQIDNYIIRMNKALDEIKKG